MDCSPASHFLSLPHNGLFVPAAEGRLGSGCKERVFSLSRCLLCWQINVTLVETGSLLKLVGPIKERAEKRGVRVGFDTGRNWIWGGGQSDYNNSFPHSQLSANGLNGSRLEQVNHKLLSCVCEMNLGFRHAITCIFQHIHRERDTPYVQGSAQCKKKRGAIFLTSNWRQCLLRCWVNKISWCACLFHMEDIVSRLVNNRSF